MAEDFDPRRAEPGQEFGYTGTDRVELADADVVPDGSTLAVEIDGDGNRTRYAVRDGVQKTLKADDQGVVHPRNAEDNAALDSFGLPVARKAIADKKADHPAEAPKG